ncbi:MAG TPA: hypothetical protein VJ934_01930 [Desulfomicrobiaceae bacterium]|jgi:hypothetical protein|nr:hypothetical protein [Desulfomicrobiaceae bacterium]
MEWIEVGRFKEMDDKAQKELHRLGELALDVAFVPEKVIRVEEVDNGVRIVVDPEFFGIYQGPAAGRSCGC